MKKILSLMLIVAMIFALSACNGGASEEDSQIEAGKVIAKVNDEEITQGILDQYLPLFIQGQFGIADMSQLDAETQALINSYAIDDLVALEVVQQYYIGQGREDILPETLEEDFDVFYESVVGDETTQTFVEETGITEEFLRDVFVKQFYMNEFFDEVNESIGDSEAAASAYYEENIEEFYSEEVSASHILVETEAEALDIINEIDGGADFAELAIEHSIDPGSGALGGELGFFGRGVMVESFEAAAFSMEVGEVSEPVESQFGYHIIKVTDKIEGQKAFEEVQDEIFASLFDKQYTELLDSMKEGMTIEIIEE